jgi:large subunit ribosomal protein L17
MHRHGYKGRKFGRESDQREALLKGLADSLILRGSIETTLPKAKDLLSYTEKLITKAKAGGLHNRRQIISKLNTIEAAHKLVDEIAPKLSARNSGHLRVKRTTLRRGDNTQLARISFVDDLSAKTAKESKPEESEPANEAKTSKELTAKTPRRKKQ